MNNELDSFKDEINKIINESTTNPIIKDEVISLVSPQGFDIQDINKLTYGVLNIVLNGSKEIIGYITFNYHNPGFSFYGNVSYKIDEKFRNNHYATRALGLLKRMLVSNTYSGDKDLYISTFENNIKSQKVATNNGGILVYNEEVGSSKIFSFTDSSTRIKVYKIELKNKKV